MDGSLRAYLRKIPINPELCVLLLVLILVVLWVFIFLAIEMLNQRFSSQTEKDPPTPHCHYGWMVTFVAIEPSKKFSENSGLLQITLCPVNLRGCEKKEQFTRFVDMTEGTPNLLHKSSVWLPGKTTLCYLRNNYLKDRGLIFEPRMDKHD